MKLRVKSCQLTVIVPVRLKNGMNTKVYKKKRPLFICTDRKDIELHGSFCLTCTGSITEKLTINICFVTVKRLILPS